MSKKTNAFQKAILFIHEQLKDTGTTVIESSLLYETNIDKPIGREVDVLIERVENGVHKRVAIECRDRFTKDDIIWIDGLIGKYLNLKVDKIIAVSSSGFSQAAHLKATANCIELRTTNEIKNIDWDNEFIKIGMVDFRLDVKIKKIFAETESGHRIVLKPADKIVFNKVERTFVEFFEDFKELWENVFSDRFNQSIKKTYRTKQDLINHVFIEDSIPVTDFQLADNTNLLVKALVINLIGVPASKNLSTKHFNYMDSVISKTEIKLDDRGVLTFITAQAEPDNKICVNVDRKMTKGTK